MPSKKRRFEFKEPSRRNSSRRRHKTSNEDIKENRSDTSLSDQQSTENASLRQDSSRKELVKLDTRRNMMNEEDASSRSTQTAPSHKDQASSTGNHLVTPKPDEETRRIQIRKSLMHPNTITPPLSSKPTGKDNEKTTQADIEDPDDASESTVVVEESHAETQTDAEGTEVPVKVAVAPLRPLPPGPLPPIPLPPPRSHVIAILSKQDFPTMDDPQNMEEEDEECDECLEEAQQCPGLTTADACSIMDECFPGFTECNDLDYTQLYGMAKVCVDEVKEFGLYFISQCLEMIYDDDCDPCTHRVGNQAMVTECNPNGAQTEACPEDCEEEEASGNKSQVVKTALGVEKEKTPVKMAASDVKLEGSKAESKVTVTAEESLQSVETDVGPSVSDNLGNVKVDIIKIEESKPGAEVKVKASASATVRSAKSETDTEVDSSSEEESSQANSTK